jgi:hypothetical protein
MKLAWVSLCALLMFVAQPAVTFAQYQERWSANMTLGPTSFVPNNMGDLDGDSQYELIANVNMGASYHVQIRDPRTGAVKFTSTTGNNGFTPWTIYLMNFSFNSPYEVVASDGANVLVIGYGAAVSAPANEAQGMREGLLPARPNPFASQVSLSYSLAAPGRAELEIYDVAGRLVRRLGGERVEAGEHQVDWDGHDQGGRSLEPGMYFYRLIVDGRASESRKAVRLGH